MKPIVILWFLLSMAAYAVGAILSKNYASNPSHWTFFLAVAAFAACSAAWMPAISAVNKLALLGMVWSVAYVIVDCSVGMGMFGETLTTVQGCGMILGAVAIVLMCL